MAANPNIGNSDIGKRNNFSYGDFDKTSMVMEKLRELKMRDNRPVSIRLITNALESKMSNIEVTQCLRSLQESGDITSIPGAELTYDLF